MVSPVAVRTTDSRRLSVSFFNSVRNICILTAEAFRKARIEKEIYSCKLIPRSSIYFNIKMVFFWKFLMNQGGQLYLDPADFLKSPGSLADLIVPVMLCSIFNTFFMLTFFFYWGFNWKSKIYFPGIQIILFLF